MFKIIDAKTEIVQLRNENAKLKSENAKLQSDLDYVAMMADVELEEDEAAENE